MTSHKHRLLTTVVLSHSTWSGKIQLLLRRGVGRATFWQRTKYYLTMINYTVHVSPEWGWPCSSGYLSSMWQGANQVHSTGEEWSLQILESLIKTPTKTPLKLPQFINYYKRTKLKFAKPPPPGACSVGQFPTYTPFMPHISPGWGSGSLHWLVHYLNRFWKNLLWYLETIICSTFIWYKSYSHFAGSKLWKTEKIWVAVLAGFQM